MAETLMPNFIVVFFLIIVLKLKCKSFLIELEVNMTLCDWMMVLELLIGVLLGGARKS